jgi:hypothetical protein
MKFFTRQWCDGELSDEDADAMPTAYRAHLIALRSRMPATLRAFAQGINIHDGRVRGIALDRTRARLTISMRCGDNQVGYFDLDITYSGVSLREADRLALRKLGRKTDIEALHDEVDVSSPGAWVHRMLFSDYQEVSVAFEHFGMRLEPMAGREFDRRRDVYVEISGRSRTAKKPSPDGL